MKRIFVLTAAWVSLLAGSGMAGADAGTPSLLGILGAVGGGVVGNQVGNGNGRTAATAAGAAAGVVIANGCKLGGGTVVGGLLGGLLGSQVGAGRGRDTAAGAGAAIGAWLGSDCSPVVNAAPPVPLDGPAFKFNGMTMVPMSGFPLAAFQGVPPIVTPEDLAAARAVSARLATLAAERYKAGDVETAMLQMYWSKRIGTVALSVTGMSLAALQSVKVGTPGKGLAAVPVSVTVPAGGLVILPALNSGAAGGVSAKLALGAKDVAPLGYTSGVNWTAGVEVADNSGVAGFLSALNAATKAMGGQGAAPQGNSGASGSPSGMPAVPPELLGMKVGQVLRLDNGAMVMRIAGALTVYNPGGDAVAIPLEKLDFMPRSVELSAGRRAAGPLIGTIYSNTMNWTFSTYAKTVGTYNVWFQAPNKVVDRDRGGQTIGYIDGNGSVTPSSGDGQTAFKSVAVFREAATVLNEVNSAAPVTGFRGTCRTEGLKGFEQVSGQNADTLTGVCFKGAFNGGNVAQVATRTFYIGEAGRAVQTLGSLMRDEATVRAMKQALLVGSVVDDAANFLPGPFGTFGNLESGLQCVGTNTLAQIAAVDAARKMGNLGVSSDVSGIDLGVGFKAARLAGWEANEAEWGVERVANCLGAIPLAGNVVKGAAVASNVVLGKLPDVERVAAIFKAFDTPATLNEYVRGVKAVEELVPGNVLASGFVKTVYDGMMTGQNILQVKKDFTELMAL